MKLDMNLAPTDVGGYFIVDVDVSPRSNVLVIGDDGGAEKSLGRVVGEEEIGLAGAARG